MPHSTIIYQERLTDEELDFLTRRAYSTRSNYFKVLRLFYLISLIILTVVILIYTFAPETPTPEALEKEKIKPSFFIIATVVLMLLITIGAYFGYHQYTGKIFKDIKRKNKTIEQTVVSNKKYMPHNNTYHLFLYSASKISVEVTEADYRLYNIGDEINIEYATFSKFFLGYF